MRPGYSVEHIQRLADSALRELGSEESVGPRAAQDPWDRELLTSRYYAMGMQLANLHNQSIEWLPPVGFERTTWDIDGITGENPSWGRFWELASLTPGQSDLLLAATEIVRHKLEIFGSGPDRYGLIHANYVPSVLLGEDSDPIFFDLDDLGFGWHLLDIASLVFFSLGEEKLDDRLQALVQGYRVRKALPDEHLEMLPTFILVRGLTYLAWLHTWGRTSAARALTPQIAHQTCLLAESYCS